jgi:uncharacterized protein (TIGR00369 family)
VSFLHLIGADDAVRFRQPIERAMCGFETGNRGFHSCFVGYVGCGRGEGTQIAVSWREEFISAPERRAVHGGVLAGLVDSGAVFAVMAVTGNLAATVDLRVDYHVIPEAADMRMRGKVIRLGRSLSTAEAYVYDQSDRLVASGRATVITIAPKPAS